MQVERLKEDFCFFHSIFNSFRLFKKKFNNHYYLISLEAAKILKSQQLHRSDGLKEQFTGRTNFFI